MEKEKKEAQNISPILTNTLDIIETRLARTKIPWYVGSSLKEYLRIESYIKGIRKNKQFLYINGYIGEGLFYTVFSDKDIQISNGKEDIAGTDFLVEEKSLNVTINPNIKKWNFDENKPPTLLLPTYRGQTLYSNSVSKIPYVVSIHNNSFPYEEYMSDTLTLNYAILREMDYYLNCLDDTSPLQNCDIERRNYDELEDILITLSNISLPSLP